MVHSEINQLAASPRARGGRWQAMTISNVIAKT
jgi:hypothetical protein